MPPPMPINYDKMVRLVGVRLVMVKKIKKGQDKKNRALTLSNSFSCFPQRRIDATISLTPHPGSFHVAPEAMLLMEEGVTR